MFLLTTLLTIFTLTEVGSGHRLIRSEPISNSTSPPEVTSTEPTEITNATDANFYNEPEIVTISEDSVDLRIFPVAEQLRKRVHHHNASCESNNDNSTQIVDDFVATKAWIEPKRLLVAPGQSIQFTCCITYGDRVYFRWSFQSALPSSQPIVKLTKKSIEGITINEQDTLESSTNGPPLHLNTLTIHNVTSSSSGSYICQIFGVGYPIKLTSVLTVSQRYSQLSRDSFQLFVSLIIASPFLFGLIIINLVACCGTKTLDPSAYQAAATTTTTTPTTSAEQSV